MTIDELLQCIRDADSLPGEVRARIREGETTDDPFLDESILHGFGFGRKQDEGSYCAGLHKFDAELRTRKGEFVLYALLDIEPPEESTCFSMTLSFADRARIHELRVGILTGDGLIHTDDDRRNSCLPTEKYVTVGKRMTVTDGPMRPVQYSYGNIRTEIGCPFVLFTGHWTIPDTLGGITANYAFQIGNDAIDKWIGAATYTRHLGAAAKLFAQAAQELTGHPPEGFPKLAEQLEFLRELEEISQSV